MDKEEFIREYNNFLEEQNLTNEQAWVGAGGTLLLLGLRETTQDIDMGVSKPIFDNIRKKHYPEYKLQDGTIVIKYNRVIDLHLDHGYEQHTIIDEVGSWTIQEVLRLKKRLNRPKDQQDIKNILAYIKQHKLSLETCSNELVTTINGKRTRTRVECYIVNNENKILTHYKPNQYPELPGGGVDNEESYLQAAKRETMEESGWLIEDLQILFDIPMFERVYTDQKKDDQWFVEQGWEQEVAYHILAKPIEFSPDHRFMNSEDDSRFSFNDIDIIISETQKAIDKADMSTLRLFHANLRIRVLNTLKNRLLNKTSYRDLSRQVIAQW